MLGCHVSLVLESRLPRIQLELEVIIAILLLSSEHYSSRNRLTLIPNCEPLRMINEFPQAAVALSTAMIAEHHPKND